VSRLIKLPIIIKFYSLIYKALTLTFKYIAGVKCKETINTVFQIYCQWLKYHNILLSKQMGNTLISCNICKVCNHGSVVTYVKCVITQGHFTRHSSVLHDAANYSSLNNGVDHHAKQ